MKKDDLREDVLVILRYHFHATDSRFDAATDQLLAVFKAKSNEYRTSENDKHNS